MEGATVMVPDLKRDFPGDVNVKQMDFAVESYQLSYCRVTINGIGQATSLLHTNLGVNTLW